MVLYLEPQATFTKPLKNQRCMESNSVTFACELSIPKKKIMWYRPGNKMIKPSDCWEKYNISVKGKTHTLTINDVQTNEAGEFRAKTGSQSSHAKLIVDGRGT